jgi:hypothetical protein
MRIIFIFQRPVYLFPPPKIKCDFPGHMLREALLSLLGRSGFIYTGREIRPYL